MIDHEAVGALSPERTSPLLLEAQVGDHPFPILIVSQEDLLLLSGEDEKMRSREACLIICQFGMIFFGPVDINNTTHPNVHIIYM